MVTPLLIPKTRAQRVRARKRAAALEHGPALPLQRAPPLSVVAVPPAAALLRVANGRRVGAAGAERRGKLLLFAPGFAAGFAAGVAAGFSPGDQTPQPNSDSK